MNPIEEPKESKWEKEFEDFTWLPLRSGSTSYRLMQGVNAEKVKSFIQNILNSQKEELKKNLKQYKCGEHKKLIALLDRL